MAIVYRVKNTINGKLYIGYTSYTLAHRKNGHTQALNKGTDTKFYRAVRKYGKSAFKWKVLATGEPEDMLKLERKLIKEYDCIKNGYNTVKGGERGNLGFKWNSKQKKRASKAQTKRFSDRYERKRTAKANRQWIQDNPDKQAAIIEKRNAVLRTDEYRKSAADKQRAFCRNNPDAVRRLARKRSKQFKENPNISIQISRSLGGKAIKVYDVNTNKRVGRYETLASLCRELSLNPGNVKHVIAGKRNHTGGYTFKYAS